MMIWWRWWRWRWYESVVVKRKISVVVVVFDGCQLSSRIGGEWSKDHPLLVVRTTQHFVVVEEELISDTEPVTTFLTSETLQMINIGPGSHHHLKCRNYFLTSWAIAGRPEQSEILINWNNILINIFTTGDNLFYWAAGYPWCKGTVPPLPVYNHNIHILDTLHASKRPEPKVIINLIN